MPLGPTPKFPVGTQYQPIGKLHVRTIIDYLVTRSMDGEIYRVRYMSTHTRLGQRLIDDGVLETTIARGIENLATQKA